MDNPVSSTTLATLGLNLKSANSTTYVEHILQEAPFIVTVTGAKRGAIPHSTHRHGRCYATKRLYARGSTVSRQLFSERHGVHDEMRCSIAALLDLTVEKNAILFKGVESIVQ